MENCFANGKPSCQCAVILYQQQCAATSNKVREGLFRRVDCRKAQSMTLEAQVSEATALAEGAGSRPVHQMIWQEAKRVSGRKGRPEIQIRTSTQGHTALTLKFPGRKV